jgi:hypothetical protein
MSRAARSRESVRRAAIARTWASLATGVSLLCACAGQPAGDRRSPPAVEERGATAGTSEAWWPAAPVDAPFVERPPAARSRPLALGSVSGEGSDMAQAVESIRPSRDSGADKSYLIPAAEILSFQVLLNQFDRRFVDHDVYGTDGSSVRRNLHRGWVIDKDPFSTNQFGHPYTGALYHGFARSAGLDYWEALGYDFAGSAIWEVAGETDPPSLNDQINTTFAGSFLGEALFRTAKLVLGDAREPGVARTIGAALVSPPSGINRLAFGDRFDPAYASHDPAVFYWLGVGARRNATLTDPGALTNIGKDHAVAAFSLDYGLPGKPGYVYDRPFDYYHFEASATTSRNAIPESIVVRGLLYGTKYDSGPEYSGIWGLYGSYDYFSPEIFKVSSTALSLGTTGQYLMSDEFALLGTVMGGVGYTATGNKAVEDGVHEYTYGAGPQALVALRLVYRDVAMLDFTANDYLLRANSGSTHSSGSENIVRAQMSLTVRVHGQHAVGLQYVESSRDPRYSGILSVRQTVGALSLFYTYLGDEHFGVVRQ